MIDLFVNRSLYEIETIQKAIELDRQNHTRQAIYLLSGLLTECPDSPGVNSYLGWFHSRCGHPDLAVAHAAKAVELSPNSEMASLVLFHACWKTGRAAQALDELKRFTAITPSEEYRRILADTQAAVR